MHPMIIQAAAAERSRDMQAHAAAAQLAREIRRSRRAQQARGPRLVMRLPLRDPRPA